MTAEELRDPRTWDASGPVGLRETHVSWVALVGDRAFKVKKPVRTSFLDFRTLEARRVACEAELRLNRRLAPDVYLAVRPLVRTAAGLRLAADGTPDEYAVEMRRFDEARTLAARLRAATVTAADVAAVGRRIARFHRETAAIRAAGAAAQCKRAQDDTITDLLELGAPRERVLRLDRFLSAFAVRHWDELEARGRDGTVLDGHGDLRAEHVLLTDPLQVVDCLEFSDELRTIDAAQDIAFLTMELEQANRPDLTDAFVDAYRDAGGVAAGAALLAFFACGRALVRAKVALIRSRQDGPEGTCPSAAALLGVAERLAWRARGRLALVVCGPAASGKSTLAAALATESGWPVLSSDVLRKQAAGLAAHTRGPAELYDAAHDDATYAELARRAAGQLARSGVIIDATFREPRHRRAVLEAVHRAGGHALVIECRLPRELVLERARARESDPARVSDATAAVAAAQGRLWVAWDAPHATVVRTDLPAADQLLAVSAAADRAAALLERETLDGADASATTGLPEVLESATGTASDEMPLRP